MPGVKPHLKVYKLPGQRGSTTMQVGAAAGTPHAHTLQELGFHSASASLLERNKHHRNT